MVQTKGTQSLSYKNPPRIMGAASVVGSKEGEGPLGACFDIVSKDDLMGCETWEEAESSFVEEAVGKVLRKLAMGPQEIRYMFAGDLLAQSIASSYGVMDYEIPVFGIYGACSTSGLGLSLASMCVAGGFADKVMAVTSSHFASAEKEFRFPLDYGSQRPLSASWTVTGSGAFVVGNSTTEGGFQNVAITGITTGRIVDYGIKDSMNMGCCMAPAAADTIFHNLQDFGRVPEDYDKIITGDLGSIGQTALIDLLKQKGYDISKKHMDCGIEIYDANTQDTHAGGSGCGCAAVTLAGYILKKIEEGVYKRVLFVPTGALLSKVSYNEGQTVPGIAHGVVIEHT